MDIITRAEANERGLKWFFTGEPCKHGEIELICDNLAWLWTAAIGVPLLIGIALGRLGLRNGLLRCAGWDLENAGSGIGNDGRGATLDSIRRFFLWGVVWGPVLLMLAMSSANDGKSCKEVRQTAIEQSFIKR